MSKRPTSKAKTATDTSSSGRNIIKCSSPICDPDRDAVTATTREDDQSGSIRLLNKFTIDRAIYDAVITRYEARRLLLQSGYNYAALELCGQGPTGYFSGMEWEQIAQVCLQHHAVQGGDNLKEYFCPECNGHHGFHIV